MIGKIQVNIYLSSEMSIMSFEDSTDIFMCSNFYVFDLCVFIV